MQQWANWSSEYVFVYVAVSCLKFIMNRIVGIWIILETFLGKYPDFKSD